MLLLLLVLLVLCGGAIGMKMMLSITLATMMMTRRINTVTRGECGRGHWTVVAATAAVHIFLEN